MPDSGGTMPDNPTLAPPPAPEVTAELRALWEEFHRAREDQHAYALARAREEGWNAAMLAEGLLRVGANEAESDGEREAAHTLDAAAAIVRALARRSAAP